METTSAGSEVWACSAGSSRAAGSSYAIYCQCFGRGRAAWASATGKQSLGCGEGKDCADRGLFLNSWSRVRIRVTRGMTRRAHL